MRRSFKKGLKRAVLAGCLIAAIAYAVFYLRQWDSAREQQDLTRATVSARFAELSPGDLEKMRANPPVGAFAVRTTGSCVGRVIFSGTNNEVSVSGTVVVTGITPPSALLATLPKQPLPSTTWSEQNPMADQKETLAMSGSVGIMGVTVPELFAARIPPQTFTHQQRADGWQVARIKGLFYWFDASDRHAAAAELPPELQAAAEDVEVQERLARSLVKQVEKMPWNATNAEKLRQKLLDNLKDDLVKLKSLRARLDWLSIKSGIPGYPSFVTTEAILAWQWGSTPTIQPPPSAPSMVKVELDPAQ